MTKILKILKIFFLFFLLNTFVIYADGITGATIYIENSKPTIESIEKINDTLEIKIGDQNGFEDLTDDGYVYIIENGNKSQANFKNGNHTEAIYEFLPNKNVGRVTIEVSDGTNKITKEYDLNQELTKVTSYAVVNNKKEIGFFKSLWLKFFSLFE